jgi:hypothetical protein
LCQKLANNATGDVEIVDLYVVAPLSLNACVGSNSVAARRMILAINSSVQFSFVGRVGQKTLERYGGTRTSITSCVHQFAALTHNHTFAGSYQPQLVADCHRYDATLVNTEVLLLPTLTLTLRHDVPHHHRHCSTQP